MMNKPSNLKNSTIEEIEYMAENIASEIFIIQGNNSVPFTKALGLRFLVGGDFSAYPEVSKIVITAYNNKIMNLILSNL